MDVLELTCSVDTDNYGRLLPGLASHMVGWGMRPGQTIEITDYRRDYPGVRFKLKDGSQVRNFDYPHTVVKLIRIPMRRL